MNSESQSQSQKSEIQATRLLREHMQHVAGLIRHGMVLARDERAALGKLYPDAPIVKEQDLERALSLLPPNCVLDLLRHLPAIAWPWKVVDMRRGEPTRMERGGFIGEPIATVKARGKTWFAFVGSSLIECPPDGPDSSGGSIGWASREAAMLACDTRLAEEGIMFVGEPITEAEIEEVKR